MVDITQTEAVVRIINDKLAIDTGTDWTAIIALVFSIVSTICILLWQNHLRKEDKKEEQKRIAKEDKIRKWNALYPYRIKFYTDFYNTLFQFVNYEGSNIEKLSQNKTTGLKTSLIRIIKVSDIMNFCSLFNRFEEEAKVIFSPEIQRNTHKIYELVKDFVDCPIKEKNKSLPEYASILENHNYLPDSENIKVNLKKVQMNVKNLKLADSLRYEFQNILKLEGDL